MSVFYEQCYCTPVVEKVPMLKRWPNLGLSYQQCLNPTSENLPPDIFSQLQGARNPTGVGLLLGANRVVAIDIDDIESFRSYIALLGYNFTALFDESKNYVIKSPKPNRMKCLCWTDEPLETVFMYDGENGLGELLAGNRQVPLPGSAYPGGGVYEHSGMGAPPPLPQELLKLWRHFGDAQKKRLRNMTANPV